MTVMEPFADSLSNSWSGMLQSAKPAEIKDFTLTYQSDHPISPLYDDGVQHWEIGIHYIEDGSPGFRFGSAQILVADHYGCSNIIASLRGRSEDLGAVGAALYEENGAMREGLLEGLAQPGRTTIVDRIAIDRRLCRYGLAVYLTGIALEYLCHRSGVVAVSPQVTDNSDLIGPVFASDSVCSWALLGFREYRGILILDPGMETLRSSLRNQYNRLAENRWHAICHPRENSRLGLFAQ